MQVPNGTGPGVRRSKRPLLASRTRCNVLWKPPKFGNKVKIGIKVQFGNKFANWCNVWSIEGVTVYGHVPECHVTFGRGRLYNIWRKLYDKFIWWLSYMHVAYLESVCSIRAFNFVRKVVSLRTKRRRSDPVLWQKPLHQQKCQKGKATTQTTPQKKFD